ncbi:unnamed protein product [Callosobruchus maculatus]|uniref:Uncharacterized protein n=1 Tax=Callosobruchus maculatus TaxID=64391 RepID=A0A653CP35_CALMS|nr:unnamed protein product [Callosobruchus maculatus]
MMVNFYFHVTVAGNLILKRQTIEVAENPNKNEDPEFILNKLIRKTAIFYLLITFATLMMFLYIPLFSEEDKLVFEGLVIWLIWVSKASSASVT